MMFPCLTELPLKFPRSRDAMDTLARGPVHETQLGHALNYALSIELGFPLLGHDRHGELLWCCCVLDLMVNVQLSFDGAIATPAP